jgi:hypothetical protein
MHFPDAVQRASGAPQIRDRFKLRACKGPGSAAHHFMLRCARDTHPGSEDMDGRDKPGHDGW